uniref:Putative methyltransferase n=1 Tax=viral metagenome TaxID=1070528 RepID=A0A6M3IET1_9ZZZZ
MKNIDLKEKYNDLHKQGASSWFSTGWEERKGIIEMGEPWTGLNVLEIGCGEGDLCVLMDMAGANGPIGIEYSDVAFTTACQRCGHLEFRLGDYRDPNVHPTKRVDRIVMEGVLEHLDDPFKELKWMIDNLLSPGGDIITSSPAFINPRGFILMALQKLFNVPITLADLHYLNPWDFERFCEDVNMELDYLSVEYDWGFGQNMVDDLKKRLPNCLRDAGMSELGVPNLIKWLQDMANEVTWEGGDLDGAAIVYHITRKE